MIKKNLLNQKILNNDNQMIIIIIIKKLKIKRMMFNKKSNLILDLNFNSIKYFRKKIKLFSLSSMSSSSSTSSNSSSTHRTTTITVDGISVRITELVNNPSRASSSSPKNRTNSQSEK